MDRKAWRKQQREKDIADAHSPEATRLDRIGCAFWIVFGLAFTGAIAILKELF